MPDSAITKRALAQAMKELMARRPFAKISVGDICEACGMNRKSFYYHFQDKYDLVNWVFYTEFLESIRMTDYPNGWEFLEAICRYFYREQKFYLNAMQIQGQNSFRDYFGEVVTPLLMAFGQDLFHGVENASFYVTFFSDAFLVSIVRWLSEGVQMPPDQYLAQLRRVMVNLAGEILRDLGPGMTDGETKK